MFGIPEKFNHAFISAWKEPLNGVELTWLELVIIKHSMSKCSVNEVLESLKAKYSMVDNMNVSKFYRIINNLVDSKFLNARVVGRNKEIIATDKGIREYGRLNRFILEDQINQIRHDLISQLVDDLIKSIENLEEKSVIVFAPRYVIVLGLVENLFKTLKTQNKDVNRNELLKQFHFINYQADVRGRTSLSSIWDGEPGNWPVKDKFADVVILANGFTCFPNEEFMIEIDRVLKSDGFLIDIEVSAVEGTKYSATFLNQIIYLMSQGANEEFEENSPWLIEISKSLSMIETREKIEKYKWLEIFYENSDFINFQLFAKKKK